MTNTHNGNKLQRIEESNGFKEWVCQLYLPLFWWPYIHMRLIFEPSHETAHWEESKNKMFNDFSPSVKSYTLDLVYLSRPCKNKHAWSYMRHPHSPHTHTHATRPDRGEMAKASLTGWTWSLSELTTVTDRSVCGCGSHNAKSQTRTGATELHWAHRVTVLFSIWVCLLLPTGST